MIYLQVKLLIYLSFIDYSLSMQQSSLPLTHIFICQLGILLYQCIYGIYSSNSLLSISTYSSIHNLSYGSVSVYIMGYGGDIHVCISLSLSLTITFSSFLCSFLCLRNPSALDAPTICASLSVSFALCSPVSMTHFKCCLQQIRIRLAISFWLCASFGVLVEFFL